MKIIKFVRHGDMLNPFYGVAWIKYETDEAATLPIPLNLVAGMCRAIWIWFSFGRVGVYPNPRDAYYQGILAGKKMVSHGTIAKSP